MGWFDSTNAILGIAGEQRAQREETASRKRENWQKLMDLANAGVDIWNIVSGRKYQTSEREAAQEFEKTAYSPGGFRYEYGKASAGWGPDAQAEAEQRYQTWLYGDSPEAAKIREGVKREKIDSAAALYYWYTTDDGKQFLKEQFDRDKQLAGIRAGGEGLATTNDFLDLVERFKGGAQGTYWALYTDPSTQMTTVKWLRPTADLEKYFDNQLGLATYLTPNQRAAVRTALMAWISNPTVGGGEAPAEPGKDEVDLVPLLDTIARLIEAARKKNPQAALGPQQTEAGAEVTGGGNNLLNVAGGPMGWWGYQPSQQVWSERDETDLAKQLSDINTLYKKQIPTDVQAEVTKAVKELAQPGKVKSYGLYASLVALRDSLRELYATAVK